MTPYEDMIYNTGMSDWFRYRRKCPIYWRNKPEEKVWKAGLDYMDNYARVT